MSRDMLASNDYAMWYGWSEMQRDLTEIKELAHNMRLNHTKADVSHRADLIAARKNLERRGSEIDEFLRVLRGRGRVVM